LPLIEWMTVRLDVSENEWRRHNKDMEPQRRGSVPPLHPWKLKRTLDLNKTTLGVGVHVQPVGLNAETKKDRHRADGEKCLLTFPFYRTCPISVSQDFRDVGCILFIANLLGALVGWGPFIDLGGSEKTFQMWARPVHYAAFGTRRWAHANGQSSTDSSTPAGILSTRLPA
jgi:hypothetical protein